MRIHHLNCGTMCPVGGPLMDGISTGLSGRLVCHCLLVETGRDGLVLVDTGLGLGDAAHASRLSPFFRNLLRLRLDPEETAVRHLQRLGFSPGDVRHIVLTHLDFDHAGGLDDFPQATVHLLASEAETAHKRRGLIASQRYRPGQWADTSRWTSYTPGGEPWFGFEAVRDMRGLPAEILLVPLIGHTWGHCGVAVDTGQGWLLRAGDAYFYRGEMDPDKPTCTPGLALYQRMMEVDRAARLRNQDRLRGLVREQRGTIRVLSAHDPVEFERAVAMGGAARPI